MGNCALRTGIAGGGEFYILQAPNHSTAELANVCLSSHPDNYQDTKPNVGGWALLRSVFFCHFT